MPLMVCAEVPVRAVWRCATYAALASRFRLLRPIRARRVAAAMPSDPGAEQQRADHHFHSREPAGKLVLVRPERLAKNVETPDDREHGTADAERTQSEWHDRT